MRKIERCASIFPAVVFFWLAMLLGSSMLLGDFPSSSTLWAIQLELRPEFRGLFYGLETDLGLSGARLLFAFACAGAFSLLAAVSRNRVGLFLSAHGAVITLGVAAYSGEPVADYALYSLTGGPAATVFALPVLIACASVHRKFLNEIREIRAERQSRQAIAQLRRMAQDMRDAIATPDESDMAGYSSHGSSQGAAPRQGVV
ncbi:hypothetical protein HPQ64_12580 [Rhizobiales bacterium]|uniref:hypothetical protein n=1 Tax=Hongsoonwoonella zoysiae TaxID=2821844 RepID=UPI0015617831|nr:hypothetical protein [Hongsoonwoonella zoysiae]NRG18525.1 hypothetical protein [Hongsoonwoonella zoysiae]